MKYAWIKMHTAEFATAVMCRVLKVSKSGYYAWLKRKPSLQSIRRKKIKAAAARSHADSGGIYGYRKVWEDLVQEWKLVCSKELVRRVMRAAGLYSKVKRKFVVTTNSDHDDPVAENILDRDFYAKAPNLKWAADITYIQTYEGWLYLAAVMDLYSRRIVGWAMSKNIDAKLVCDALEMAILQRRPGAGLLHHSDRGVQYTSEQCSEKLALNGIECSMSRRGDCWDNACMESFFGKLKTEHVQKKVYRSCQEARQDLFWYIEVFYNRKRRHASLGYISPVEFEKRGGKDKKAA